MDGNTHIDVEIRALKVVASRMQTAGNRAAWRSAMQRRSTRLWGVLAALHQVWWKRGTA